MIVLEVGLPFLGVTVTITLQEPTFNALTEVPSILQNFVDNGETLTEVFEPETALSFA